MEDGIEINTGQWMSRYRVQHIFTSTNIAKCSRKKKEEKVSRDITKVCFHFEVQKPT